MEKEYKLVGSLFGKAISRDSEEIFDKADELVVAGESVEIYEQPVGCTSETDSLLIFMI